MSTVRKPLPPPTRPIGKRALNTSLRACLPPPAGIGARSIQSATEITPGLSGSRLFRVRLRPDAVDLLGEQSALGEQGQSLILKVPDWGTPTSLASRDVGVGMREIHFYESGLAARLPDGLRAPRLLGIDHTPPGPGTWLWMEDVAPALAVRWNPERAVAATRSAGRLHALFVAEQRELEQQRWLERDGYAAYAHHVPAAHRHLEQLPTHPHWTHLFNDEERAALHRALDLTSRAITELRRLPPTLIHGDFHIDNLGCDPDGTVVAIDWAHVGIAPIGSDVAVLTSLYTALGGTGNSHGELESAAIEAYCDQIAAPGARAGTHLHDVVRRACGLWNVTWGLHLRLGPGLDWLLRRPDPHSADAARSAVDVRHGCLRAVTFLAQV